MEVNGLDHVYLTVADFGQSETFTIETQAFPWYRHLRISAQLQTRDRATRLEYDFHLPDRPHQKRLGKGWSTFEPRVAAISTPTTSSPVREPYQPPRADLT